MGGMPRSDLLCCTAEPVSFISVNSSASSSHATPKAQAAPCIKPADDLITEPKAVGKSNVTEQQNPGSGDDNVNDNINENFEENVNDGTTAALLVRWMATGGLACSVPDGHKMTASALKVLLHERLNVPVAEQRLFAGGRELIGEAVATSEHSLPLMVVRSTSDPRITNLAHFRVSPSSFRALPSGSFTSVRKLGAGVGGDVFAYKWRRSEKSEEVVAVKRFKNESFEKLRGAETVERNVHVDHRRSAPDPEDALTEIGVLSYLAAQSDLPIYLLRMLGVFTESRFGTANAFTWLVTEYADGGELFEVAASGCSPEIQVRRYIWQLLQAVAYLHRHRIGHRDLSLENILLRGGVVRVTDFGMAVQSHSATGTPLRYYRAVGKDFYRAPECHVPTASEVSVTAPFSVKPGSIVTTTVGDEYLCEVRLPLDVVPGKACKAEVWGYAAAPADVFGAGICFFILGFQGPPWHQAVLADPSFAYVHRTGNGGLDELLQQWRHPLMSPEAMKLLGDMLNADPKLRPTAAEALNSPWFASLAGNRIPTHAEQQLSTATATTTSAGVGGGSGGSLAGTTPPTVSKTAEEPPSCHH